MKSGSIPFRASTAAPCTPPVSCCVDDVHPQLMQRCSASPVLSTATCVPGLMGALQPPSSLPTSRDSAMPGICKELLGQAAARLRGFQGPEESLADRLVSDLSLVYVAVQSISDLYSSLDEDSQENGDLHVQPQSRPAGLGDLVKAACRDPCVFCSLCVCSVCVQHHGPDSAAQLHCSL